VRAKRRCGCVVMADVGVSAVAQSAAGRGRLNECRRDDISSPMRLHSPRQGVSFSNDAEAAGARDGGDDPRRVRSTVHGVALAGMVGKRWGRVVLVTRSHAMPAVWAGHVTNLVVAKHGLLGCQTLAREFWAAWVTSMDLSGHDRYRGDSPAMAASEGRARRRAIPSGGSGGREIAAVCGCCARTAGRS